MFFVVLISVLLLGAIGLAAFYLLRGGRDSQGSCEVEEIETEATELSTEITDADLASMPRMQIYRAQTIGKRGNQEDALYCSNAAETPVRGFLAAVADGIGGLDDGQIASRTALKAMADRFAQLDPATPPENRLLTLTADAHREVWKINQQGKKIGCTLVSVLIADRKLWLNSVGDSRIYLFRAGTLIQLNRAHVFGKENDENIAFLNAGQPADARRAKALTAFLGKEGLHTVDRNIQPLTLVPGDQILLMSDGVFGTLTDETMVSILQRYPADPAADLIAAVEQSGRPSQDNATVIVANVR